MDPNGSFHFPPSSPRILAAYRLKYFQSCYYYYYYLYLAFWRESSQNFLESEPSFWEQRSKCIFGELKNYFWWLHFNIFTTFYFFWLLLISFRKSLSVYFFFTFSTFSQHFLTFFFTLLSHFFTVFMFSPFFYKLQLLLPHSIFHLVLIKIFHQFSFFFLYFQLFFLLLLHFSYILSARFYGFYVFLLFLQIAIIVAPFNLPFSLDKISTFVLIKPRLTCTFYVLNTLASWTAHNYIRVSKV